MLDSKRRLLLGVFALTALFGFFMAENRAAEADFDLRAPFWRHSVNDEARWLPILSNETKPVRRFVQPQTVWGAGHRGVDYKVDSGENLFSPSATVVQFAGLVFGRPVVVLRHSNGLSSEFEPACLAKDVALGQNLQAGQMFGQMCFSAKNGHCERKCLHWGVKTEAGGYLSPERFTAELPPSRLVAQGYV